MNDSFVMMGLHRNYPDRGHLELVFDQCEPHVDSSRSLICLLDFPDHLVHIEVNYRRWCSVLRSLFLYKNPRCVNGALA